MVCLLAVPAAWAQLVATKVKNAEVVYVEGNVLVLKMTSGEVEQFELPDSYKFTIDGKDMAVTELKPGMKLTATITTTIAPRWVDMVKVVEVGTVWKIEGSNVIIKTPEGQNKMYHVPSGGMITIEGKEKALNQLREGDRITATVVTTRSPVEAGKATAQGLRTPATPARVGVLLIDEDTKPAETPETWGTSTIMMLVVALLLVTALVLLALLRKRNRDRSNAPAQK